MDKLNLPNRKPAAVRAWSYIIGCRPLVAGRKKALLYSVIMACHVLMKVPVVLNR